MWQWNAMDLHLSWTRIILRSIFVDSPGVYQFRCWVADRLLAAVGTKRSKSWYVVHHFVSGRASRARHTCIPFAHMDVFVFSCRHRCVYIYICMWLYLMYTHAYTYAIYIYIVCLFVCLFIYCLQIDMICLCKLWDHTSAAVILVAEAWQPICLQSWVLQSWQTSWFYCSAEQAGCQKARVGQCLRCLQGQSLACTHGCWSRVGAEEGCV